ncbi:group IIE secretory phospholipase A2-like isoform X2 [Bombina bombina]|nr:group IIE secretory phospholipase A2-like isoform X2 [Bombina bombina]
METPLLLILLCVAVTVTHCSLIDFGIMIHKVVQRSPLNYVLYGCHCGYGGRGQPMDNIDWCCHKHDCCFDYMVSIGCKPMNEPYKFTYIDGNLTCDSLQNNLCAQETCECDREATLCFKDHNDKYSQTYRGYKKRWCTGQLPPC